MRLRFLIVFVLLGLFLTACKGRNEEPEQKVEEANGGYPAMTAEFQMQGGNPPVTEPGKSYRQMILVDETVIDYALVLPDNFTAGRVYPTLLALPPGDQSEAMVEAGLAYWEEEAMKRGWVVISPVAPNFTLFFQGSESYLPEFLNHISEDYPPEGGKFHVSGVSNGGISAFRLAVGHPELVNSLVVLPGYPLEGFDQDNLANLKDIPVAMFVGENDTQWVSLMKTAEQELIEAGARVTLEVKPGEGHVIRSMTGVQLFDLLESFR